MDNSASMPTRSHIGKRRSPQGTRAGLRRFATASAAVLVWLMACTAAMAQESHAHDDLDAPLAVSDRLGWSELIDTTLNRYPQFVELAARDEVAAALLRRSNSLLSGMPSVSMRYQTDRPWDNVNLREYELGLSLPLWRIGQRKAAGMLGDAASDESQAAAAALRHEVIGILRTSLWDIEQARVDLAVAEDGLRISQELQAVIERRYNAGDLPLSETCLMGSDVLDREVATLEARARLVDAERAYRSLTGLDVRPAQFAESQTARESFDESHPSLLLADAELERAQAQLELSRKTAKGAPTLTLGPRREQASFSDYAADSLGVTIAVPFGGRGHASAATQDALRAAAQAESQRRMLLRDLELDLHEARHGLSVIEESLALAQRRAELAQTSFELSREAFEQGEKTLQELLLSEEAALLAQREVSGLEVDRQRTIAQINHAVGVWP
jgi:cobalt-zinc-cadmium efflux system outer membrane protein